MNKIKVIILAAGFGERFDQSIDKTGSLSDEEKENFFFSNGTVKPKALLKICDQEILSRNIDQLKEISDIDLEKDVTLVTNHKYYKYFKEWLDQNGLNIRVIDNGVSEVKERKGAVVDMYEAVREANIHDGSVLVMSSDILFGQFKIRELIEAFKARGGEASMFPVYMDNKERASRGGAVDFNSETKIINKFVEKPKNLDSSKEFWVSPALYLYNKEAIQVFLSEYIKESQGKLSLLDSPGQFNEYLVKQGNEEAKMEALEIGGERFEISNYKDWREASDFFYRNETRENRREFR